MSLTNKKITSIKDAQRSMDAANSDLIQYKIALAEFNKLRVTDKLTPELMGFLVNQFPQFVNDENARQRWHDCLEMRIEELEKYIESIRRWLRHRETHPHRCALPKKKQREMGLLPPI